MTRPYSTSRHTSARAVSKRLRSLVTDSKNKVYEVIIDSGSGSHSELVKATSIAKAARKAAASHKMTLGPMVVTANKPTDRTGYRVTFHGGMFGGDKESIMFVSQAHVL